MYSGNFAYASGHLWKDGRPIQPLPKAVGYQTVAKLNPAITGVVENLKCTGENTFQVRINGQWFNFSEKWGKLTLIQLVDGPEVKDTRYKVRDGFLTWNDIRLLCVEASSASAEAYSLRVVIGRLISSQQVKDMKEALRHGTYLKKDRQWWARVLESFYGEEHAMDMREPRKAAVQIVDAEKADKTAERQRIAELEAEKAELQAEKARLGEDKARLEDKLAQREAENARLQAENERLQAEKARLQKDLDTVQKQQFLFREVVTDQLVNTVARLQEELEVEKAKVQKRKLDAKGEESKRRKM